MRESLARTPRAAPQCIVVVGQRGILQRAAVAHLPTVSALNVKPCDELLDDMLADLLDNFRENFREGLQSASRFPTTTQAEMKSLQKGTNLAYG